MAEQVQAQEDIVSVFGRLGQVGNAGFNSHHIDAAQFARAQSFDKSLAQMGLGIGLAQHLATRFLDAFGQLGRRIPSV